MKKLRTIIISLTAILGMTVLPLASVTYADCSGSSGSDPASQAESGVNCIGGTGANTTDLPNFIKTIVNVLLFVLGAIAVIMIIIGGIRYTTSNGDASQTKAAKDTILYAVIGLVVAILAYAIVNFVISSFKK